MHGEAAGVAELEDVLVFLLAAVVVVPLFKRLRASPVLGYLVAGAVIGPFGFRLVSDVEGSSLLAELGVVFLLFIIGLELSLQRLRVMRRLVFGVGTAQVAVTLAVIAGVAAGFGLPFNAAVVIGGGLALSSTAIVLQILSERGELTTQPGRVSFAVLLLQDLAVVPLLLFTSLATSAGGSVLALVGQTVLRAVLAIAAILVVARVFFKPMFPLVARTKSPELFSALSLLLLLGTAWITATAGMSMALGAFLAGLLLAETEYRHQVDGDMQPFKGLLLGLFFITVGMRIDVRLIAAQALPLAGTVLAIITLKTLVMAGVVLAFRMPLGTALRSGLLLAQVGEFGFVLFGMSEGSGLLPHDVAQLLTLATAVTMAVTPVLAALATYVGKRLQHHEKPTSNVEEEPVEIVGHVLIAGFGRIGQTVATLLRQQKVEFVALDLDPGRVTSCRNAAFPVYYGDASRAEVLLAAGARTARAAVVALTEPEAAVRAIDALKRAQPNIRIYARVRDNAQGDTLMQLGAAEVVPEVLEASLQLGRRVLTALGAKAAAVEEAIDTLRRENYSALAEIIPHSAEGAQPNIDYYAAPPATPLPVKRDS